MIKVLDAILDFCASQRCNYCDDINHRYFDTRGATTRGESVAEWGETALIGAGGSRRRL